MPSLLGHLGQKISAISTKQEDIASEGLAYILNRSDAARLKFGEVIGFPCNDLSFSTQNVGKNKERTDISGHRNGCEVLIIEAKFWANLTDNQPMGYLGRLQKDAGTTGKESRLVFVCPESRRQNIFNEIKATLEEKQVEFQSNVDQYKFTQENHKITILVKSWEDLLIPIRNALEAKGKQELVSDMDQIIGLCKQIEETAFLPFQKSDFSPEIARKNLSFIEIADKIVDKLCGETITVKNDIESVVHKASIENL